MADAAPAASRCAAPRRARRGPGHLPERGALPPGGLVASRRQPAARFRHLRPVVGQRASARPARPVVPLVRDGATLPSTATRAAGPGSATARSTTSSSPTACWSCTPPARRWSSRACSSATPISGGPANNLALDLGHAVQVNAYLSPAAAKGLELHFDYHDVFVLQLDGAKRWRVWEPLERTRHPVRSGPREPMPTFDELGRPGHGPHAAGRRLPLPAAWLPARRRDGRRRVVAPDHRGHRPDLAPGGAPRRRRSGRRRRRCASRSPSTSVAGPASRRSSPHLDPQALRRWMAREVWRRQPATRLRPLYPPTIGLDTRIVVTPGPLLWLTPAGDRVELGLGDRALTMPAEAGRSARRRSCAAARPFTLGGLDVSLDDASRLVVGAAPRRRRGGRPWLSDAGPRFECAEAARERAASRSSATASQVSAWLLVEVNGPWGRDAIVHSELGPHAPLVWRQAMKRQGIRADRRPPRPRAATRSTTATASCSCTCVAPRPGRARCRRVAADDRRPARGRRRHGVAGRRPRAWRRAGSPTTDGTCSSARTVATTRAARRSDVRSCVPCASRAGPTRCGSARTSAATASPATSCCCRTACTSGTSTPQARSGCSAPTTPAGSTWPPSAAVDVPPAPSRPPSTSCAPSAGLDAVDAVRSIEALDDGRHRVVVDDGGRDRRLPRDARADRDARPDALDVQGRARPDLPVVPPPRPRQS